MMEFHDIFSREFLPHETEQRAYSFCGTIEYIAPEVVRGGNHGHDIVSWKIIIIEHCVIF